MGSFGREKEVLGIQRNGREEYADLAFWTAAGFQEFLARSKAMEDLGPYRVESMERRNHRVITIPLYDMNLPEECVTRFLERYSRVVAGPKRKRDSFGFWDKQRVYEVLLREDEQGFEGCCHPPALCSVDGVRGHLVYSRQPPFCRRCMEVGHAAEGCEGVQCHNCGGKGHMAAECREPKACNVCGSGEHLMRS